MTKYIIFISITIMIMACQSKQNHNNQSQNTSAQNHDSAYISIDSMIYDFGQLHPNDKASHFFKFKNTGKTPLVLTKVGASCGCTVVEYPKTPIAPNEQDSILVKYTGITDNGDFLKAISVHSNASNGTQCVQIKGHVLDLKSF